MIGFIIGFAVLIYAIHYFTGDRSVDWKQVGIWLLLSFIPYIIILFILFGLAVGGGLGQMKWLLFGIALISQLGILYFFLDRDYGYQAALKILGTYVLAEIVLGLIF